MSTFLHSAQQATNDYTMLTFRLRFLDADPSLRTQADLTPERSSSHEMFVLRHAIPRDRK